MNPQIVNLAWDGAADSRPVHLFIDQAQPEFATPEDEAEFSIRQAQTLAGAIYGAVSLPTLMALAAELLVVLTAALALPGQLEAADG